jgi:ribose-phosphate pyrophosphokinase
VVEEMFLIGDVKDKNVILIDDMIDTAGTLCKAADILMEKGAKSVRAMATHGVLSGKAYENIENSKLLEVIVTDSIPQKMDKSSKIKVLSCASLFADVMNRCTNTNQLVINSLFKKKIIYLQPQILIII